jgi:hypothetical protein
MDQFKTDRASYQLASRNPFVFNTISFWPDRHTQKLNPVQLIENKRLRSPQIATKSRFSAVRCLHPGSPTFRPKAKHFTEDAEAGRDGRESEQQIPRAAWSAASE